ncbi:MAG: hypothetical protein GY851_27260 [bacterium]|nr:hypothetical protein [bacterium]
MKIRKYMLLSALLVVVLGGGCARAALDTAGFQMVDDATFKAPMEDTWQAAKSVLREMDLELYTRDKRGRFVAYTPMKRKYVVLTPQRNQLNVTLEAVGSETTKVSVETMRQVYGVTLLTYPDWHDRKTTDNRMAQEFLAALKTKMS